jgi:hypothetical protein
MANSAARQRIVRNIVRMLFLLRADLATVFNHRAMRDVAGAFRFNTDLQLGGVGCAYQPLKRRGRAAV